MTPIPIRVTVNGREHSAAVPPRLLLTDFLRERLRLTGTHVGCEHGVCGACTVIVNGEAVRSCLMLAAQVNGRTLTTIEGVAPDAEHLHPIQEAFREAHGLQCGFCTPGMVLTSAALLAETPEPHDQEIRELISGNLCRCTGYVNIVRAVRLAAERLAALPR
jgi:carbon-monoxide dehydrogenase small subunit